MIEEFVIDIRPISLPSPVEFHFTLEVPCSFSLRTFVEKLQELFCDEDTSMVTIKNVTCEPTVVSWYVYLRNHLLSKLTLDVELLKNSHW